MALSQLTPTNMFAVGPQFVRAPQQHEHSSDVEYTGYHIEFATECDHLSCPIFRKRYADPRREIEFYDYLFSAEDKDLPVDISYRPDWTVFTPRRTYYPFDSLLFALYDGYDGCRDLLEVLRDFRDRFSVRISPTYARVQETGLLIKKIEERDMSCKKSPLTEPSFTYI